MRRIVHASTLAVITLSIVGCSVITSSQVSYAPEATPTLAMPTVVTEPVTDLPPLTDEQLLSLVSKPVSVAVHRLTIHGYEVEVIGDTGAPLPQAEWDFHIVAAVDADGFTARVSVG